MAFLRDSAFGADSLIGSLASAYCKRGNGGVRLPSDSWRPVAPSLLTKNVFLTITPFDYNLQQSRRHPTRKQVTQALQTNREKLLLNIICITFKQLSCCASPATPPALLEHGCGHFVPLQMHATRRIQTWVPVPTALLSASKYVEFALQLR
eukprot:m.45151 g.45151  ORF g.45151 m.45151 type:complete len:151 (+) comp33568_c0_seq1:1-453(+)